MTSTNEELPPPPKPRASPFDYRNTDLVSRLLAATPPYLYNMPLVPHSFFFSEMLRSLVQAKAENASRTAAASNLHHRRSRKRSWTQAHSEYFHQKEQPKVEKPDMPPPPSWITKPEKPPTPYSKPLERPLELTTEKFGLNNNTKMSLGEGQHEAKLVHHQNVDSSLGVLSYPDKQEVKPNHMQFPFPPVPPQTSTSSEIILPPPPPVWYPPLYPTPYGIDPLHFFIDLRVSGHIYDRKNQKDSPTSPHTTTSATSPTPSVSSTVHERGPSEISHSIESLQDPFRQTRHSSAFSVPSCRLTRNIPINLSNYPQARNECKPATETKESTGRTKFDVKSMGFERSCNKTSLNYVMGNIFRIYKELQSFSYKTEPDELKHEETRDVSETTTDTEANDKETEEEKEKRVKDLRALIGLELVVDYMNHSKPGQRNRTSEESSTDLDSSDSTAVDVVAIQEESEDCRM